MKKPDFFIIGAPRSGTTALSEYLKSHPEIYISTPKEPNYFSFDMSRPRAADTLDDYLKLFQNTDKKVTGEASVWYMYSKVAIPEIMRFNPKAKIIAIVRNPIDWFRSWHAHRVYTLNEDTTNIELAWQKQEERKKGQLIPKYCREPELLYYKDAALFGNQVERVIQIVPEKQFKIIVFDDFIQSTKTIYENLLSFLDVTPDKKIFPRIHQTKMHRSLRVATTLRYPSFPFNIMMKLLRRFGIDKTVRSKITSLNTVSGHKQTINLAFRKELSVAFRNDVKKLEKLINRDLSHWLTY